MKTRDPENILAKRRHSLPKALRSAKEELIKNRTESGQPDSSCVASSKMLARKNGTAKT
jgi:hypothetical protein